MSVDSGDTWRQISYALGGWTRTRVDQSLSHRAGLLGLGMPPAGGWQGSCAQNSGVSVLTGSSLDDAT